MITQKSIQEIIETAKIEEVVEDFVSLKRSGSNMKGLCPFHNEKTPSFMVSPSKNIFKCFGCGKGGNSVQFIMEHESLSFPESLRFLAQKFGIQIEETKKELYEEHDQQKTESLYLINEYANAYFTENLFKTAEGKSIGLSYFKERGYREHTIHKFGLGYAVKRGDDFTKKATEKKYNIELLRELGLTTKSDYDFFRNRVIFPIHNLSGKVIAFAGRIMNKSSKAPKYINSPESEIYNKSKTLYGAYLAKQAIRKLDQCILVEGYTDVITLHQSGIENVLASSGTALTEDQIRLIKRYTKNILILYDSDPAGIKAALRGIDMILEQDMDVKLVLLPKDEDPDSYLKKLGVQAFTEFLATKAEDFILFKTHLLQEKAGNDPVKKVQMLKDIVGSLSKIRDPLKRSIYIAECSKRLDVAENILVNQINKIIRKEIQLRRTQDNRKWSRQQENPLSLPQMKTGKEFSNIVYSDDFQERDLVRLIVTLGDKTYDVENSTSVAEYVIANIRDVIELIDNDTYKKIITETAYLIDRGDSVDYQFFINHNDRDISQLAINLLSSPYSYAEWEKKGYYLQTQKLPDENFMTDSLQAIMRLKERKLSKSKTEIEKRIREAQENADENYYVLLKAYQKVKNLLSEIQKSLGTVVPSKN